MANLTIEAAVGDTEFDQRQQGRWVVSTDPDTVYFFYLQSRALVYKKWTTGGGLGSAVTVISTTTATAYDIYYDKWTKGITTTRIHCVVLDQFGGGSVQYRNLDVSTDTLGTQVAIATGLSHAAEDLNKGFFERQCSICTAENGNIYLAYRINTANTGNSNFYRSTNNGGSFSTRTSPFEAGESSDRVVLFPADDADLADIRCLYYDRSANAVSVKTYDDSANTWPTETAVTTVSFGGSFIDLSVAQLHSSGDAYFTFNDDVGAEWHGRLYSCSDASTVTALTSYYNDGNAWYQVISIDQTNDDIYTWYVTGSLFSDVHVYRKVSTDLGSTWSSATQYDEGGTDDYRGIGVPSSIGNDGGELAAGWYDEDDLDIFSNFVNSINIPSSGGTTPVSNTQAANLESLIGLKSAELANIESQLNLRSTELVNLESLVAIRDTTAMNIESLVGLKKSAVAVIESIAVIRSAETVNIESLLALRTTAQTYLESLTGIRQQETVILESLVGIKQEEIINLEALGIITSEENVNVESLLNLRDLAIVNSESLTSLTAEQLANLESLLRIEDETEINFESLSIGSVEATALVVFEALQGLEVDSNINIESLSAMQILESLNYETLLALSTTQVVYLESLVGIEKETSINYESLSPAELVVATALINIESLQGLRVTKEIFLEAIGLVQTTQQAVIEVLTSLRTTASAQYETLVGISQATNINIETLFRLAKLNVINFEALSESGIVYVPDIIVVVDDAIVQVVTTDDEILIVYDDNSTRIVNI